MLTNHHTLLVWILLASSNNSPVRTTGTGEEISSLLALSYSKINPKFKSYSGRTSLTPIRNLLSQAALHADPGPWLRAAL